jgi:tetratricopeptide (TPR) repeat protein
VAKPFDLTIVRKRIIPKASASDFGFRSLMFREKGNRDKAAEDADLAYSLDPDAVDARQALAAVDIDLGKYEEALKLLSSLKNNPFDRLLEATAYAKKGDIPRAVEVYTDVPEAQLATTALRRNARTALLSSLQSYVQERLEKAGASESMERFFEAMAEYTEAVRIADDATTASIRQRVGILIKANPYLAELAEEARKHALRGDVLIKEGAFADALAEYRTAVKLAPLNPQLRFGTALICGQLKEYREAISSMNAYLQLSPDAPNARAAKDEIYKWEFQLEKEGKK